MLGRPWRSVVNILPDGGIGDVGPPPDIDGRRDTDNDRRRAALRAKTQMALHGQGTTSFEGVDRRNLGED